MTLLMLFRSGGSGPPVSPPFGSFTIPENTRELALPWIGREITLPTEENMSSTAAQRGEKAPGEVAVYSIDFGSTVSRTGKLAVGDLLTGTPTIVQDSVDPSTATSLTLATKIVNTSQVVVNGRTCLVGEALQVTISAGEDLAAYRLKCTCSTVNGETLVGYFYLDVIDR